MYTAVVTGARGQDGSYLCELLEEKGYHVVKFTGDVRDYDEMYETIKKSTPDEVGRIDGEVMIEVSPEFYRPDNGTLLVGNNDPIRKLGWTREYDIHSLIEDMLKT
jgi:GDP-D-mannose dehydratase